MTQAAPVLQTVFQTSVMPRNGTHIASYLPVSHLYLYPTLCNRLPRYVLLLSRGFASGIKTVLNCLEGV